jgi:acetylornithine deacetylase/succinyl-diaminopimelate desuccinylase-like protein
MTSGSRHTASTDEPATGLQSDRASAPVTDGVGGLLMGVRVDAISDLVDRELEATIALLERLIAEPSVEGSDRIRKCLDIIEDALQGTSRRVRRPAFDGLESLVCEWGDPRATERFLLTGHADVVPADGDWQTPPFVLTRKGDALYGRGVCDMKGALAAFVGALKVVAQDGGLADAPISLVVTGDEEVGSPRGMIPLLRDGEIAGTWAVCGEPTDLRVFTGNRGVIWLRVEIRGKGGHAGLAHLLQNPVHLGADVVAALARLPLTVRDLRFDPPTPSLAVTSLTSEGEPVANIIPGTVSIGVDRRLLPGESPDTAVAQIEAAVASLVTESFEGRVIVDWTCPPYIASTSDPLVTTAQRIVRDLGRSDALGTDSAADDSSWLGEAGISTILIGPGEPVQAHAVNETIGVSELRDAIEVYSRLCLAVRDRQMASSEGAA